MLPGVLALSFILEQIEKVVGWVVGRTIEGAQLYGGACKINGFRMLIATTQARETAYVKKENMTAG